MEIKLTAQERLARRVKRRAPTAQMLFRASLVNELQFEHPRAKMAEINKMIQEKWKSLRDGSASKEKWNAMAKVVLKEVKWACTREDEIKESTEKRKRRKELRSQIVAQNGRPDELQDGVFVAPRFNRMLTTMGRSEKERKENFLEAWKVFDPTRHVQEDVPTLAGEPIDLYALFRDVVAMGGFEQVGERDLWDSIVERFEFPVPAKVASLIVRTCYHDYLLDFEQAYQVEARRDAKATAIPDVIIPNDELLAAPTTTEYLPSLYTGNYFVHPGTIAIGYAFRSRVKSEVIWATNQLLYMSYNQNEPFVLESNPGFLEILAALLQNQLLVVDYSTIAPRRNLRALEAYWRRNASIDHEITWPDIVPAVLVILRNLSMLPANQQFIAMHDTCIRISVLPLAAGYNIEASLLAGDIICNVSPYLEIHNVPHSGSFLRWLHGNLCATSADPEVDKLRLRQGLSVLITMLEKPSNHEAFAHMMGEIFKLIVLRMDDPDPSIVIHALEAAHRLCELVAPARVRFVQSSDCIPKMLQVVSRPYDPGTIEIVQRTAAAALAALYAEPAVRASFHCWQDLIFGACSSNYEVAFYLGPILQECIDISSHLKQVRTGAEGTELPAK